MQTVDQRQLSWEQVRQRSPIWLNLGGRHHCHPHPQYREYVSVDELPCDGLHVIHDLREPIPLPDASVARLHSEDTFHFLSPEELTSHLRECHRLLKPGGRLRCSVPDYNNPKDKAYRDKGVDPRHPRHQILPTRTTFEAILAASPFSTVRFYHYWDGETFVAEPFDVSLGMIQRTPENDIRNREVHGRWLLWNFLFRLRHGFQVPPTKQPFLRGSPLHVTSLVVDCIKE